jgi:spermidine/putrescine transport system substrate-binding protein
MEPTFPATPAHGLSRRAVLQRAAAAAFALPAGAALLEAFAGSADAAVDGSGQIVLNNYPGWIGKNELAAYAKKFPGDSVKMVTNATSSTAEVILQYKTGSFDVLLSDTTDAGQADAAGLIQKLDWTKIPNIKNVSANFRKAYPWGIPTDYGKVGIGYRPDIVGQKITSWHDVWRLAPKFSGRVVFIDLERDAIGSTLKYLGYSSNTSDPKQIAAAQKALITIKPHLQAFLNTNVGAGLVNGSTAIAMDWDYDIALLKQKQPKIEWVAPTEGMHAYLEGFSVPKSTKNLDLVEQFLNFALDPKQYADFVNTTGTAYTVPTATPFVKKSIATSPILKPSAAVLKRVEFDHYLGAKGTELFANAWQEVKAA